VTASPHWLSMLEATDQTRGEQAEKALEVFELSQNLTDRWLTANYATKRQILDIVFSNCRLDGVSLSYEMRKPFALLAEGLLVSSNRGDKIRTCDLLVPNQALYQAELRPVQTPLSMGTTPLSSRSRQCLHLDRHYRWQIPHDRRPTISHTTGNIHLPTGVPK
jgi:hypothetical protein